MRISDWSSDVCSSDLKAKGGRHDRPPAREGSACLLAVPNLEADGHHLPAFLGARKSVVQGKSVSVRVDLGVRRIIKKKKKIQRKKLETLSNRIKYNNQNRKMKHAD